MMIAQTGPLNIAALAAAMTAALEMITDHPTRNRVCQVVFDIAASRRLNAETEAEFYDDLMEHFGYEA